MENINGIVNEANLDQLEKVSMNRLPQNPVSVRWMAEGWRPSHAERRKQTWQHSTTIFVTEV